MNLVLALALRNFSYTNFYNEELGLSFEISSEQKRTCENEKRNKVMQRRPVGFNFCFV
jgi:hypothetical protein